LVYKYDQREYVKNEITILVYLLKKLVI